VATGVGECKPTRNGATFLSFLKEGRQANTGADVHVVLDNLPTHTIQVSGSAKTGCGSPSDPRLHRRILLCFDITVTSTPRIRPPGDPSWTSGATTRQ
jgi:hypothetical protein